MSDASNSPTEDDRVFVPISVSATIAPFAFVKERDSAPWLRNVAETFGHNLCAVSDVCGMPAMFASVLAHDRRLLTATLANEILSGAYRTAGEEGEALRRESRKKAEVDLREGPQPAREAILGEAGVLARAFSRSVDEILRQGVVLLWGAIEVLASDLFVGILNASPSLIQRLAADEPARRMFVMKQVSLDVLAARDYNIATCMGDLALELHAIDNVASIKTAFLALFPRDLRLRAAVSDRGLYEINSKRNLIVHRRGVVDDEYRNRMSSSLARGERLCVTAAQLGEYLCIARDVGVALLGAACDSASSPDGSE